MQDIQAAIQAYNTHEWDPTTRLCKGCGTFFEAVANNGSEAHRMYAAVTAANVNTPIKFYLNSLYGKYHIDVLSPYPPELLDPQPSTEDLGWSTTPTSPRKIWPILTKGGNVLCIVFETEQAANEYLKSFSFSARHNLYTAPYEVH